jgi:hypothetical protein
MSSFNQRIKLATELIAIAGVTNADRPSIRISLYDVTIQLQAKSLARVFFDMKVPRSRLKTSVDVEGNLHISFTWRSAEWRALVWAKEADEWRQLVEQHFPKIASAQQARIAGSKQLALPLKETVS